MIRKLGTLDLGHGGNDPRRVPGPALPLRVRPTRTTTPTRPAIPTSDSSTWRTGKATPAFAKGYDLGCAYAEGDAMWVFGVDNWDGENIAVFRSTDLEHWEQHKALNLPGWGLFNTSVCKAGDRYVMAIEVGKPPQVVGVPFTMRFAESKNLLDWKLLPEACVYTKERYSACPALRYLDGWFYMLYLEARPGPSYETHLVRSTRSDPLGTQPAEPGLESLARGQADRQPEADRRPEGEDCRSRGPEQLGHGPVRVQGQDDHHV